MGYVLHQIGNVFGKMQLAQPINLGRSMMRGIKKFLLEGFFTDNSNKLISL